MAKYITMKTEIISTRIKMMAIYSLIGFFAFSTSIAANSKNNMMKIISADTEAELTVETWMYDLSEWNTGEDGNNNSKAKSEPKDEKLAKIAESEFNQFTKNKIAEDEIVLEDWMLSADNKFWNSKTEADTATSEEIEIEEWMLDLSKW